jgi:iron complex transport system substrate-binding protein
MRFEMKIGPLPSINRAFIAIFIIAILLANAAHAQIRVTDDRGKTVVFAAAPQRIVSVLPSLTESVCELGACQRLVGVDRYSNFPATVKALPQVGGGLDPSVELIASLKPDVVLVASSARAVDKLESLGLKVLALEPKNMADVSRIMRTLAQLLGTDVREAERVLAHMRAATLAAKQSLKPQAMGLKVYMEVGDGYAASPTSFVGELMTELGAKHIVPADKGPFPQMNPEWVVRAQPDVLIAGAQLAAGMVKRPGWQRLKATQGARLCKLSPADGDVLVRPGPRMAEAARWLAGCFNSAVN